MLFRYDFLLFDICCFFYYHLLSILFIFLFFFFNDTATTEIYTLSLHDALPISRKSVFPPSSKISIGSMPPASLWNNSPLISDRKSTRLNSSHQIISYAVFCLKKKKKKKKTKK